MSNIAACLSSKNVHYCSPPTVLRPTFQVLRPGGRRKRVLDPASNGASIVPANFTAAGLDVDGVDGLELIPTECADAIYCNPPYGAAIKAWARWLARWGQKLPTIALLPSHTGPGWMQDEIKATATAWCHLRKRLVFWLPIPLERKDAADVDKGEPYYLRRWYPWATDETLPEPFRSVAPGYAVGPELDTKGKPQSAPFNSMVAFWGHEGVDMGSARTKALEELIRSASHRLPKGREQGEWLMRAEQLLGPQALVGHHPGLRSHALTPYDRAQGERVRAWPPSVHSFVRQFLRLGDITVARGPHAGHYDRAA